MKMTEMITRKVTLYFRGEMMGNYHKVEARAYFAGTTKHAQYPAAVQFAWVPKGSRAARGQVQTFQPSLVILDGHGHPDPAPMMGEKEDQGGVTVQRGRHSSCSPEWTSEFNEMIDAHIVATGACVLADFRKHNPNVPTTECDCDGQVRAGGCS